MTPIARINSLLLAIALFVIHCTQPQTTLTGTTMGTTYNVVLRGKVLPQPDAENLRRVIQAELDRLEHIFSTYRPDSEISRLNGSFQPNRPYPVSNDMAEVLRIAARVKAATGGAFSPLVGALVDYWGFGPGQAADTSVRTTPPAVLGCASRAEFSLVPTKGSQKGMSLVITNRLPEKEPKAGSGNRARLQKGHLWPFSERFWDKIAASAAGAGVFPEPAKAPTAACAGQKPKLDLSAIAKGYAVDRLGHLLMQNGFSTYLVEIGGEICVRAPTGSAAWRIGIEDPLGSGSLAQAMEIHSGCVATSGNSRQARTVGSRRVTHIINPLTGQALERNLSSVSIMAATAAEADAWATGLFVLGMPKAIELAAAQSMAVMYLEEGAGRVQKSATPAWPHK
ncbi:MAG: FAD:protein FMN transferase [Turneriella sp.]